MDVRTRCVYEPSEDTYLLVETARALSRVLTCRVHSIVEVGSGSGIASRELSGIFKTARIVAVDLSPYAVAASAKTLSGLPQCLVVHCNAGQCIHRAELAVFNPPYLPPGEFDELLASECGGWLLRAIRDPEAMRLMCLEATRFSALAVVAVYSSLSPVNLEACLEERGFRVVLRRIAPFFFEKLIGVAAIKRGALEGCVSE